MNHQRSRRYRPSLESLETRCLLRAAPLLAAPPPLSQHVSLDRSAVSFDANRALLLVRQITALGPRISGTPAMARQQALLRTYFHRLGLPVHLQTFTVHQASQANPVTMTNLIVSIHPELHRRVILSAHYDTRPLADQEPDPRHWHKPYLGANDATASVAFLMEMARQLKSLKTKVGVDLVFFDGEEYIFDPSHDRYFFGSDHFAQAWRQTPHRPEYLGAVLLDMIAGKNAHFPFEPHALALAGRFNQTLWQTAARVGSTAFVPRVGPSVLDDHLALLGAGIPSADVVDISYPYWHRLGDVPANLAPGGMLQVARVLAAWLPGVR